MAVVEILTGKKPSESARAMLDALARAIPLAGDQVVRTDKYKALGEWLVLFGYGAAVHDEARNRHVAAGGKALMWDLGYFGRQKVTGFLRMSINDDHCNRWLDDTQGKPKRWAHHAIELREDADPGGPIVLVGLGRKSRAYLNDPNWELRTYGELLERFPGRPIVYRPKGADYPKLPCDEDSERPIAEVLKGASLVVCRHSNVGVDAAVAGVPFEAVDGAAMWLAQRPFTRDNRLEFLRRLSWWQWRADEAGEAWAFAKDMAHGRLERGSARSAVSPLAVCDFHRP